MAAQTSVVLEAGNVLTPEPKQSNSKQLFFSVFYTENVNFPQLSINLNQLFEELYAWLIIDNHQIKKLKNMPFHSNQLIFLDRFRYFDSEKMFQFEKT